MKNNEIKFSDTFTVSSPGNVSPPGKFNLEQIILLAIKIGCKIMMIHPCLFVAKQPF